MGRLSGHRDPQAIGLAQSWLGATRATLEDGANPDFERALEEALAQCLAFERIVDLAGLDDWKAADLQRFLEESRASLAAEPVLPPRPVSPRSHLRPPSWTGELHRLVGFSRESAPAYVRVPFSAAERAQLSAPVWNSPLRPTGRSERRALAPSARAGHRAPASRLSPYQRSR